MTTTASSDAADRLEKRLHNAGVGVSFTDDHRRCVTVLEAGLGRLHNLAVPGGDLADAVEVHRNGLSVLVESSMSTFDTDELTRLVVAAHQHRCRVELRPWHPWADERRARRVAAAVLSQLTDNGFGDMTEPDELFGTLAAIDILITAREADGDLYTAHPGLDRLAAFAGE